MTQPPGHIAGGMKWHIYRYPPKINTLLVLGSILTDPKDPESSLNYESGIKPWPSDLKLDQTQAVRLMVNAELSKNLGGKLKAVLPTVVGVVSSGGSLEASRINSIEGTVEAMDISAEIIKPGRTAQKYMDEALQMSEVVEYVKSGGLTYKPLYLIVGVATCKKLIMGESKTRGRTFSAEADANLGLTGVEAGAGVSFVNNAVAGVAMEVQEECAFAYRVREFRYSRLRKGAKVKDVTDGSLFGEGNAGGHVPLTRAEAAAALDEVPVFDAFESEDEELDDEL